MAQMLYGVAITQLLIYSFEFIYLITKVSVLTNSEVIGIIFISKKCSYPVLCMVKKKENID